MRRRNFGVAAVLSIFALVLVGCSAKKGQNPNSSDAQAATRPSTGTITGTVQVALGSGDVKNLAFTNIKLAQQGFSVFSDSEKQAITFDVDEGIEARQLGQMSGDDLQSKTQAKTDAMDSFQTKLPEKEAIQGVAASTTNASGNFNFSGVQPGTYWLLLDTQIAGNYVGWNIRVEVKPGVTTKVALNNTNTDYAFR